MGLTALPDFAPATVIQAGCPACIFRLKSVLSYSGSLGGGGAGVRSAPLDGFTTIVLGCP